MSSTVQELQNELHQTHDYTINHPKLLHSSRTAQLLASHQRPLALLTSAGPPRLDLSRRPTNYSNELLALPALVAAARAQLRAEAGGRVQTLINLERVRNATALLDETSYEEVP